MGKEQNRNVTFSVSVDEANKILKALGNLPFVEVYELIGKLNEQANNQLTQKEANKPFVINGKPVDPDQFFGSE